MTLIALDKVSRRFGDFEVLADASLRVEERDRVGIVGDNGAGKTTLIKILAGCDEADGGTRSPRRGLQIAYAEQIPALEAGTDVRSYVQRGDGRFESLGLRIAELEHALARTPDDERLLADYGAIQSAFEAGGGYRREHLCERVLSGLGIAESDWTKDLSVLSGGEKSRVVLAALMTAPVELLILDEPTNHLDLQGIQFVEGYVQRHPGAVVVISHDRRFLDAVTTRTVEVEDGRTSNHKGNYSAYRKQKDQALLAEARAYKNQQAFVDKELDYIRRNMAGRMHRQAKGRLKKLQRLEILQKPKAHKRSMRLGFASEVRGQRGQTILEGQDLVLRVPDGRTLIAGASFRVEHGEAVGLVGRNGSGKTTLLRAVSGERPFDGGRFDIAHGVRVGTFRQELTHLPPGDTVLEALRQVDPQASDGELRDHLGLFLFSGEEVGTRVADLSGGEKQRLSLARLTRSDFDVLCLDEPTNHLDISGREGLERAIAAFTGSVLVVSHDRQFLESVADRVLYLTDGELRSFRGGLTECMAHIASERQTGRAATVTRQSGGGQTDAKPATAARGADARPGSGTRIRNPILFQRLEDEIIALEEQRESVRADMTQEHNYLDPERMRGLQSREREIDAKLNAAYERWENWN